MPQEAHYSEFDDTILPWIGRTMKLVDLYIVNQFRNHSIDLTKVQMILLVRLYYCDGQPQNDLAMLTNRDKASLARLLDTMERKGLVVRVSSKEDKRIKLVHITKKGIELYEQVRPIMKSMISHLQQGINDKSINQMIQTLKRVQKNIALENTVALQTK